MKNVKIIFLVKPGGPPGEDDRLDLSYKLLLDIEKT